MGPCSECGGSVAHRQTDEGSCSLGSDSVPWAEHEWVKTRLAWITQNRDGILASYEYYLDTIAEVRAERNTMLANLTATQRRCTELLEEVRASDALKHEWIDKHNRLFDIYKEQESELVDLKVENERLETLNRRMDIALCDCCNGTATWRGEPCPECNPEGDFVEDQDT